MLVEIVIAAISYASHPVETSVDIVTELIGAPEIADELLRICHRESRCTAVDVHAIDSHLSDRGWRSQVALGHLNPACQPWEPGAWATRGPFGLSASSHWEYLFPCYPPEILDIAFISTYVAAKKYLKRCTGKNKISWCPS